MYQVGEKVTWTSQSAGSTKTKEGTVHAIVPAKRSAYFFVPDVVPSSSYKFDTNYADYERFIIAVPRGGKSTKVDYYCPRPSLLRNMD